MKFLHNALTDILSKHADLTNVTLVLPGKRPIVFIRRILQEKNYSGFMPNFLTVEELIKQVSKLQEIKGVALWLFAYDVYRKRYPSEEFSRFLKWFPTLQKDWDDMLKFTESDRKLLEYMLDEERIKNWGEGLGDEEGARRKNLNFWRKMNDFLPDLRKELQQSFLATSGMISEKARENIFKFVQNLSGKYYFLGFNAFTPVEEMVVKTILQWEKGDCYFQADRYYMEDYRQEAGKFLRDHKKWKEFNDGRPFKWIENDFSKEKSIKVYEVSGNVSQTKILPDILGQTKDLSETAVVLLDENLLPAALDALGNVASLNITMGFPLKNLSFSNAVKQVFYLQKQLLKKSSTYYYNDLLPILEEMPKSDGEQKSISHFLREIQERNIVYIPKSMLEELLSDLRFYPLLKPQNDSRNLLRSFISFCEELLFDNTTDPILYENIAHFLKNFRIIENQLAPYGFEIGAETLEVLIQQLVNTESIDFEGEPLQGLQVMGLLETRLLNFKNIILLSVNEGKLPLGNSQNTYLPFDVRQQFGLNTFIDNDGIYAYHFYRLLQDSENVHLLFNALTSGVNTGEKSRFITQLEMESSHQISHIIVENTSEPAVPQHLSVEKTSAVLEKLQVWKNRVSVSHLTTYLYNPVDFYFSKVLGLMEADEIEEELSARNYGNLIHYALQELYEVYKGKILSVNDMHGMISKKEEAIHHAIEKLKHQPEFYERGMNFIHKSIASKVLSELLNYDLELVKQGNSLEIIDLERRFENIDFFLNEEHTDKVSLYGYIDRIDRLNGNLRIIDYKTAKTKNLSIKIKEETQENFFRNNDRKQAMQLCLYQYVVQHLAEFSGDYVQTGIWSFAEVQRGAILLEFSEGNLEESLVSIRNLILEILNPKLSFSEELPDLSVLQTD